jgi:hypothetical protein
LPGAFATLLRLTEAAYDIDYTIIDLNPSLSAINQNLFLISNAFIIPTNPDPFSIMALHTLKSVLPRWIGWKQTAIELFTDSAYPLPEGTPKFLGSLIQRFNIRKGRAARPYRDNIADIKTTLASTLAPAFQKTGMALQPNEYGQNLIDSEYCLSEIPDFQGLLPKAYDAGVPVFALNDNEINETGPILTGLLEKREQFNEQFQELGESIVRIIGYT